MLDLLISAVEFIAGLTILMASLLVLADSQRAELSLRTAAAVLIGGGGAVYVGDALSSVPVPGWSLVLLPPGVTMWIAHAASNRTGEPMRRATDWAELEGKERAIERRGAPQ